MSWILKNLKSSQLIPMNSRILNTSTRGPRRATCRETTTKPVSWYWRIHNPLQITSRSYLYRSCWVFLPWCWAKDISQQWFYDILFVPACNTAVNLCSNCRFTEQWAAFVWHCSFARRSTNLQTSTIHELFESIYKNAKFLVSISHHGAGSTNSRLFTGIFWTWIIPECWIWIMPKVFWSSPALSRNRQQRVTV